ncbi:UDP phosphate-alpha-4-amino-4-deoxy-L-arabinose arabinosyl transferase [Pandoraea pneumonica]|uniref:UDP phosphate-alpha-4-amino-4-deoxy-L-arabinose arabinosyl transferase n=1 Tax=Pandoraea pneumonica TaxID=2508299 RepID=A0A5E4UW09_9BURK|nr:glycosyltransferase family 39 protein [Pandoraea pneumonica]VVE03763.1 UDP phosphate-alpha-4-amino-4-deoxy-L-arabinose arabinosyl transferase [Pandoraea pneumonica]
MSIVNASSSSRIRKIYWLSAALLFAFLLAGLFDRDPWKADEPYSVGMVLNFFRGHDLIVPRVGADPFVEKPPVMYWTGAIFARLTSAVLPVFQGAQLAVLAWLLISVFCVARLAQRLHAPAAASDTGAAAKFNWLAPMLMVGSFGAIENIHKLTADVPQMAGAALALVALARLAKPTASSWRWGLLLGTGAGIAFLSKGLLVPGVLALTALAAFVLPAYRTRRYAAALGWAVLAALPWVVIWPALFWRASEPLFIEWFWDNNFGRFFGFVHLGGERKTYWSDFRSLLALTFPAGWLAVGALVAQLRGRTGDAGQGKTRGGLRRFATERPELAMLWLYVVLFVLTLVTSSAIRDIYMLSIFPALGVLGAGVRLPNWLEKTWSIVALVLMSVLGVFLWVRWGLQLGGHGHVAAGPIGKWLPLDYVLPFSPGLVLGAVIVAALWVTAIIYRRQLGALVFGFAGLLFVWGTLSTLLLPWINEARSYRTPFVAMMKSFVDAGGTLNGTCVGSFNVGESERAMLDYFVSIRPVQLPSLNEATQCRVLLVLDKAAARIDAPAGWREVWQGGRAGDTNERFRLLVSPDFSFTPLSRYPTQKP